ncbi:hypothetical protein CERSUDRAFT_120432 [Gelatoporia subvermispora B]|uniref:Uncharacterized protein n=1 Tax=Ceriporiopsis subvermispora (strain B) TaxID=914234 RepID=M2QVX1_CERS8|nr:hypothetical protein CERSUDRAFT_120432 [Gelatoporia subvermispora B]
MYLGYTLNISLDIIWAAFSALSIYAIGDRSVLIALAIFLLNGPMIGFDVYNTYSVRRDLCQTSIRPSLANTLLRDEERGISGLKLTQWGAQRIAIKNILVILPLYIGLDGSLVYILSAFSQPIQSILITHFLLNLRQAAYHSQEDTLPSLLSPRDWGLCFRTSVDDMGEEFMHGDEPNDPYAESSGVEIDSERPNHARVITSP